MHHLLYFSRPIRILVALSLLLYFVASQIFWIVRIRQWKQSLLKNKALRVLLDIGGAAIYVLLMVHGFSGARQLPSPTHLTLATGLLEGPFLWWVFGSVLGFGLYLLARGCGWIGRASLWLIRRRPRRSLRHGSVEATGSEGLSSRAPTGADRRQFLHRTAMALGAAPFVAGAYGIFYGRLNLKVTHPRITLSRLPRSFDGFRILQISDLHIGPFMSGGEIRKVVEISNRLRPELVVLTGDFVTWDPSTQYAVVDALSGLRAPYGVFGCLGNHEMWTHTADSITQLFAARHIRILRQEQRLIREGQESINLIGVDFQTRSTYGRHGKGYVHTYLRGVEQLVLPGTVNVLMSHNPNTFDRAAQLGIDLSLAGHTHGGQVAVEFVHVDISPARLITPYVRGWFKKGSGQLYVNRGIGTIGIPIRLGSTPEITVYHLQRDA